MSNTKAIIGYQNLIENAATITASSQTAAGPVQQAWDGITTTYWEIGEAGTHTLTCVFSSPVLADYFGVFAHNLATAGAQIKLQYSRDVGVTWRDAFDALQLADNYCGLKPFPLMVTTHWRVHIVVTTAPLYIGVLQFGAKLLPYRGMPVGFVYPADSRETEIIPNRTESGAFAGRSVIPRGTETELQINVVPEDWLRREWRPFVRWAEKKPFFFSWNHTDYPEECVYAMAKPGIPSPSQADFRLYNLRMPIVCLGGQ